MVKKESLLANLLMPKINYGIEKGKISEKSFLYII